MNAGILFGVLINEGKFINAYGFICFPDKFTTNVFEFSLADAKSIDFMSMFVMYAACMYIQYIVKTTSMNSNLH